MKKRYTVKKIMRYFEYVEVEAESSEEALELSNSEDGDLRYDALLDHSVIKVEDIDG